MDLVRLDCPELPVSDSAFLGLRTVVTPRKQAADSFN